ncbi:hypothetical protein DFP72DRAFT_859645 [Ephemerocybe angulata]|uniref:Ribonucleoside-diphosphate reductase n=1 Tax=Ephemerocybe angulata TaxID=980116 RepID=A0A8H6HBB9_9AGAR|nr:hypothetical protein DFP72DRAFT_859645 [Tulosesus angulatus]
MPSEEYSCFVSKKNGTLEEYDRNKVVRRLRLLMRQEGIPESIDGMLDRIAALGLEKSSPAVDSCAIDSLLADISASLDTLGSSYRLLSAALELSNIYAITQSLFSDAMHDALAMGLLDGNFIHLVDGYERELNDVVRPEEDRRFGYPALRVLRSSYLLRQGKVLLERPQYMWLRVALHIHGSDLEMVKATYNLMSTFMIMPSTTLLANGGLRDRADHSSYRFSVGSTSDAMLSSLGNLAILARDGARLDLECQSVPAERSIVGGVSQAGLVATMNLLVASLHVAGCRPSGPRGAVCFYLEPWHAEFESYMRIIKARGRREESGSDPHYGLLLNDLFMTRVRSGGEWSLFCPSQAPLLLTSHGADFDAEYARLEASGVRKRTTSARRLWRLIAELQVATGGPSITFKDAANSDGTLLPVESITPPSLRLGMVRPVGTTRPAPSKVARHAISALYTSTTRAFHSQDVLQEADAARVALGVGVLGLADAFALMNISYDSDEARQTNLHIAETVRYCTLDQICRLSRRGTSQPSSPGTSPAGPRHTYNGSMPPEPVPYDWKALEAQTIGSRASVDCRPRTFSWLHSVVCLVSTIKVPSKVFAYIPGHFLHTMEQIGLWNSSLRDRIIAEGGEYTSSLSISVVLQYAKVIRLYKEHQVYPRRNSGCIQNRLGCGPDSYSGHGRGLRFRLMSRPFGLPVYGQTVGSLSGWMGYKTGFQRLVSKTLPHSFPVVLPKDVLDSDTPLECIGSGSAADPICLPCCLIFSDWVRRTQGGMSKQLRFTIALKAVLPTENDDLARRLVRMVRTWTAYIIIERAGSRVCMLARFTPPYNVHALTSTTACAGPHYAGSERDGSDSDGHEDTHTNQYPLLVLGRGNQPWKHTLHLVFGLTESWVGLAAPRRSSVEEPVLLACKTIAAPLAILELVDKYLSSQLVKTGLAQYTAAADELRGSEWGGRLGWVQVVLYDGNGASSFALELVAGVGKGLGGLLLCAMRAEGSMDTVVISTHTSSLNTLVLLVPPGMVPDEYSQILTRTAEGMQAYRLAKQILAVRYPSRWGQKCGGGGHEDMRTSFVWAYLKLKYGEDDGRKTVAGRIYRVTKTPSTKLPAELRNAATRHLTSQLDYDLAGFLGLTGDLGLPTLGSTPYATCVVAYGPYTSPNHPLLPSSSSLDLSLLSLFETTLNGNILLGGSVDLNAPWMFVSDSTVRLLGRNHATLKEAHVKLHCHGKRYERRTRWSLPKAFFHSISPSELSGAVLEHTLILNLNSSFVLCAIQAVLPDIRSFSKMTVLYELTDTLVRSVTSTKALGPSSATPPCQEDSFGFHFAASERGAVNSDSGISRMTACISHLDIPGASTSSTPHLPPSGDLPPSIISVM